MNKNELRKYNLLFISANKKNIARLKESLEGLPGCFLYVSGGYNKIKDKKINIVILDFDLSKNKKDEQKELVGDLPVITFKNCDTLSEANDRIDFLNYPFSQREAKLLFELVICRRDLKSKNSNVLNIKDDFLNIPEVMVVSLNKSGEIDLVNSKTCKVLKKDEKGLIGLNWFENFLPESEKNETLNYFKSIMSGKTKVIETHKNYIINSKKELIYVEWNNKVLKNNEGDLTGLLSSGKDITESSFAEKKLKESEERFRAIFENANDAIFIKDRDLKYTHINFAAEKLFNLPASKVIGKSDKDIFKKDNLSQEELIDRHVLDGEIYREEKALKRGVKIFNYSIIKAPIKDSNLNIMGICGIGRDVTNYKEVENDLIIQNKINEDILRSAPFGVYVVNKNGGVDYVNDAMLKISAANYDRFMSLNLFKHGLYRKLGLSKKIKETLKGKGFKMEKIKYKSSYGKKTTYRNFIGIPLRKEKEDKALMIVEDITQYVEYEQKISNQNKFLMTIIDSLSYPFYVINIKDYKILLANKEAIRNRNKIRTCYEVSHNGKKPCSTKDHRCPIREIIKTNKPAMMEHVHYGVNGEKRHVEVHGYPIFNENGKVERIIEYSIDVTENKLAKLKMAEQEEKFKDILDGAHDLIQSIDVNGKIIYVNKSWKDTLGYSDEEIKNINIFDIIHSEDRAACKKKFDDIFSGKNLGSIDTRFLNKMGGFVYVSGSVSCKFKNGKPSLTRGIFRDVTKQKQEEDELKKRTDELERFNKVAVDREIKMIELKKKIRELESNNI